MDYVGIYNYAIDTDDGTYRWDRHWFYCYSKNGIKYFCKEEDKDTVIFTSKDLKKLSEINHSTYLIRSECKLGIVEIGIILKNGLFRICNEKTDTLKKEFDAKVNNCTYLCEGKF